jgi:deoxyribonuclease-4
MCNAPVGEGAKRTRTASVTFSMLIGAHVSSSGGLSKAHGRGVEWGCDAIQVFHQSPRAWRPTTHSEDDIERFREQAAAGGPGTLVIHAVYLINCAAKEPEIREKSLRSLVHALQLGDAADAAGVILHPGSKKKQDREESLELVGEALRHGLDESERCPLLLENTAGAGDTLGRTFEELADLLERGGGGERLGLCLDSAHLLASGYDVRSVESVASTVDACEREIGLARLRCLHVNDSKTPLGSNRDRHENLPCGELGPAGLAAFLSEPRFDGLPALLEVAGHDGHGPGVEQITTARRLREEGLAARA